jgi:hypothetical protein
VASSRETGFESAWGSRTTTATGFQIALQAIPIRAPFFLSIGQFAGGCATLSSMPLANSTPREFASPRAERGPLPRGMGLASAENLAFQKLSVKVLS